MGIQSSINKIESNKKSSQTTAPSPPSSPLDIQTQHLETFILVWLDERHDDEQNQELQSRLRKSITNLVHFDDVKSCEQWLKSRSNDEKILLVVSGRFGKRLVPIIHDFPSIIGIYIFCWMPENHTGWTQTYSKVRRVISKKEQLLQQIFNDQIYFENIEDSKTFQIFQNRPHTRIIDLEYNSVIWYQLFLEILISPSYFPSSPSPNEFIHILRRSSSNDQQCLNLIKEFEQTYSKQNAIKYLTDNPPLSRILNKALREQNISLLFYLRFFLIDISNQLISNQLSSIYVYRKQIMSSENIQKFCSNINNYLMLNHFIQTSTKPSEPSSIHTDYQTVFIEIDAQYHDGTVPFAYVHRDDDDLSVLFMCGAIFKIISFEQNNDSTWKLKLSLAGNKELNLLNEKKIKLKETNDLLMIAELLDQSNQSDKTNIYCQELLRQLPSNHSLIPHINDKMNINLKVEPILLRRSKFVLIDLTRRDLSDLAFEMLNVLQMLTNNSILIAKNCSEINFDEMKNKTIFIFTNSRICSSVEKESEHHPRKLFILGEKYFQNSEDFIFQLADELYRCYLWEVQDDTKSGDFISAKQKQLFANQIHKKLKEVHRTFSSENQSIISTETTIIWLKFNNQNDEMITSTKDLFEKLVSSFLVFDDPEECYSHVLCTEEHKQSLFLIIDDNYKDISIAALQGLNNIKQIYRYNESRVRYRLTYDLICHYNQLANQCEDKKDIDNAKKLFLKARDLCEILREL